MSRWDWVDGNRFVQPTPTTNRPTSLTEVRLRTPYISKSLGSSEEIAPELQLTTRRRDMSPALLLICLCCSMMTPFAAAENILLLPFAFKSHVFEITAIGRALKTRGHNVSIMLPPSYPDIASLRKGPFEVVEYKLAEKDLYGLSTEVQTDMWESLLTVTPIQDFRQNIDGFIQLCSNPLSDPGLLKKLRREQFDFAIVDAFPGSRCLMALLYQLDVPYASLTTTYEPWLFRAPALPSFVPFPFAQHYTERMTLWEKFANLLTLIDWTVWPKVEYLEDRFMRKYLQDTPEKPYLSLNELSGRSLLWLFDSDTVIDYARPTMPNEVYIGGLSTMPAKALPSKLDEFAEASEGLILVSFGSFFSLTDDLSRVLLEAFKEINMNVIWSFHNFQIAASEVPPNVRVMDWVPQNDILGHRKTCLFITHCGANGQFEALYHGVPMLGFPIFADQPYNARRMAYRGYGLYLDLLSFTSKDLTTSIMELLHNQSYSNNIKKASAAFRDRPENPRDRAAFWVEHVMKHGAQHLRSHALDMPWYEYLMLDMLLVCLVLTVAIATLLTYFCLKCIACFRSNKSKGKKKKY